MALRELKTLGWSSAICLLSTEPWKGHDEIIFILSAQFIKSCTQFIISCAQFINSCAQFINLCAQFIKSCAQFIILCAQFIKSCAQFISLVFNGLSLRNGRSHRLLWTTKIFLVIRALIWDQDHPRIRSGSFNIWGLILEVGIIVVANSWPPQFGLRLKYKNLSNRYQLISCQANLGQNWTVISHPSEFDPSQLTQHPSFYIPYCYLIYIIYIGNYLTTVHWICLIVTWSMKCHFEWIKWS